MQQVVKPPLLDPGWSTEVEKADAEKLKKEIEEQFLPLFEGAQPNWETDKEQP